MFGDKFPDLMDLDRFSSIYVRMKRRRVAEVIAEESDGITEVKARDNIIQMEDAVLEEVEGDFPDKADSVLRAVAQSIVIDRIIERWDDDR